MGEDLENLTREQLIDKYNNSQRVTSDMFGEIEQLTDIINIKDEEIAKLNKINDLMASAILNYDDQLEINHYRDKEHVKETFKEFAIKEDK